MTEDQKKAAEKLNDFYSSPEGQKIWENRKVFRVKKAQPESPDSPQKSEE